MAITVYARIDREAWGSALPMSWDKTQNMFRHLSTMDYRYQLTFETNVLANSLAPAIRCSLIRWDDRRVSVGGVGPRTSERQVILQTSDPKPMEAALFMLINEAEQEMKNGQIQI